MDHHVDYEVLHQRRTLAKVFSWVKKTDPRVQTRDLNIFPFVDRSLINYDKYHKYVGDAGMKYHMSIQATRGCPYKCFYCDIYKTNPIHNRRTVEHFFDEVQMLADLGIKRFEFIDDIFNVNRKSCKAFFEKVIKSNLKLYFAFPVGLKGDLLDEELIDIMVEGGALGLSFSLEHAADRMQKIMRKNLNVQKLHDNLTYITKKHPQVNLKLNAMHGFPSETEEEAMKTLDFMRSIKWIDWPYLHNVRIFPGTEIEVFALEQGIPKEIIKKSQDMSYHEHAETLPFSKEFTNGIKTKFLMDCVINKKRLLERIPHQLKLFTREELDQKIDAYFVGDRIKNLTDLMKVAKIKKEELDIDSGVTEKDVKVDDLDNKFKKLFAKNIAYKENHLKLLLIDLSTYYSADADDRQYNVVEPPLGLLALMTFLNQKLQGEVKGKIVKSLVDFDSNEELLDLIKNFKPDLIGFRAMTFYSGFFHDVVSYLRKKGIRIPIIAGGPYPTASYSDVLKDKNVNAVAIAEGEHTLYEICSKMIKKGNKFLSYSELDEIKGIAYYNPDQKSIKNTEDDKIASIPVTNHIKEIIKGPIRE